MGVRRQLAHGLFLLGIGLAGRLLPHLPNFTPLEAIALYSGAWLRPPWLSASLVLLIMAISDAILGWHSLWPFTWSGMVVGVFLGHRWLEPARWLSAAGLALGQAVLFFLWTNFGVWLGGGYGYTLGGLAACYIAALPFFHYQALGALSYSTLFWAVAYTGARWPLLRPSRPSVSAEG